MPVSSPNPSAIDDAEWDEFLRYEEWLDLEQRAYGRLEIGKILNRSEASVDRVIASGELPVIVTGENANSGRHGSVKAWHRDIAVYLFRRRKTKSAPPTPPPSNKNEEVPPRRGRRRTNPVRHVAKASR